MKASDYERVKARAGERSRKLTLLGQDIAPLPPVADPLRRAICDTSFRDFCEQYFPMVFQLAWSADHLRVIEKIERVVKSRETFAVAMPRGSGKSSLCMVAVLWAICAGWHKFVFLIAATEDLAGKMLTNVKQQIQTNDLLLADYPESCYPVRSLEGETRRCSGQRYYGVPTRIEWGKDEVIMATLPNSAASGAIIRVAGIEGSIRGALHVTNDGTPIRPTLVICDDPQNDASAKSHSQTQERLSIINGAVTGLAGPSQRTGIVIPCTVIRPNDLADTLLDRERNPEWQGERTKMVLAWPKNEAKWTEYKRIRDDEFRCGGDGSKATAFYAGNRTEMDDGAAVSWLQRFEDGKELSAVHHAMNIRFKIGDEAFAAEYQNEPVEKEQSLGQGLTVDDILTKLNGAPRGEVPADVTRLTMYVDIHGELLYWMVCGWTEDFGGRIIDYGTFPDQRKLYFTLANARNILSRVIESASLEGRIYAGLERLIGDVAGREWRGASGTVLRVERCMIDANWGQSTNVIYQFCRQSKFAAILLPSHGKFIGASSVPFSEYKRRQGERLGHNWRIPGYQATGRAVRHILIDVNYWKSFVHGRLGLGLGERGGLTLCGKDAGEHQLLADHITAEYCVKVEARGRTVDEWKWKADRPDNHWLDCLTGCAAGASERGCQVLGETRVVKPRADSATPKRSCVRALSF